MTVEEAKDELSFAVTIANCSLTLSQAAKICEALGIARRALDANQSWISIKDALPEMEINVDDMFECSKDVYILMVDDSDSGCWEYYQVVGCYTSDGWCYYTYSTPEKWMEEVPFRVTHWMPVIELPA